MNVVTVLHASEMHSCPGPCALVRYVAVAELCSLPLSVLRCEEDEDIVGTCP